MNLMNKKVNDLVSKGLFDQTVKFAKTFQLHCPGNLEFHENAYSSLLPSIFKACSVSPTQFLPIGIQFHAISIKTGSDLESITSNSLLSMYAKSGQIEYARKVFDTMPVRDIITWNSMINSYIQQGYFVEAIEKFKDMYLLVQEPKKPELVAGVLSVCGKTGELRLGRQIHARIVCDGMMTSSPSSVFVSTALVDMYSRCFDVFTALEVFSQMIERNEVSWTAMISGCVTNENFSKSLELFRTMQITECIEPNRVTLIEVLPACAHFSDVKQGKQIHGYAIRHGFDSESRFEAALLDMYCKCGAATLSHASLVFERSAQKDVVMWSSMIRCYSQNGDTGRAMKLFQQMRMAGTRPNSVTLLAIIDACTFLLSVKHAEVVHGYIVKSGLSLYVFVGNSLIDMYAKCGYVEASRKIFSHEIHTRDYISWSAIIHGYALNGNGREALRLFREMQKTEIEIDGITFLSALSACNHSGLIEEGQELFNSVIQNKSISVTVEHYACYIDILGRSGKLEEACQVLSNMPMKPSAAILSSLVSSCKVHGRLKMAEVLAKWLIDLEPDNAANYTLHSMVSAEMNNWLGVEEIRRGMRNKGLIKSYGYSWIEPDCGAKQGASIF
ncbi:hypothetical protein C5167_015676 [Papaver somniferum]|uniref:Pentacotripeptide-repeat region of PRORP domain-containing protein n=1 Tax=Papaver somniferum TaxID=3469 RepID=A0A4Y7J7N8_PAPSO|nr:pentatricopeptide repeat-containing protein At4g31070, mitochondrial-like [Papaver somniferum]RZC56827.1 hypothetical protein C5167_015676 [Papaver somniferum]